MIYQFENILLDASIFKTKFHCNIEVCKGACCVKGEIGAPVTPDEISIIESILPKVTPILSEESNAIINDRGVFEEVDGEYYLNTIQNQECIFVVFKNNIATCAFETLYHQNEFAFQKPISCHLFPIRVRKHIGIDVLRYEEIPICACGKTTGEEMNISLLDFLQKPLQRMFGKKWVQKLILEQNHL